MHIFSAILVIGKWKVKTQRGVITTLPDAQNEKRAHFSVNDLEQHELLLWKQSLWKTVCLSQQPNNCTPKYTPCLVIFFFFF